MRPRYFYKGRHRAGRFSQSVYELIRDCQRISIDEMFAMRNAQWSRR